MMPLMMVSCCSSWGKEAVIITGSKFAGKYMMQAAITSAQVRLRLSVFRGCNLAPQRPQLSWASTSFHSAAQWLHGIMPRVAAVFMATPPSRLLFFRRVEQHPPYLPKQQSFPCVPAGIYARYTGD